MKKTAESTKLTVFRLAGVSVVIVLALVVMLAILADANNGSASDESKTLTEVNTRTNMATNENANVSIDVSATIAAIDYSDLFEQAHLIIRGVVTEKNEEVLVQAVRSAEPMCFTDKYIEVLDIYRGAAETRSITIRVAGGSKHTDPNVGVTNVDYEPDLVPGEEYILFLYKPNYGGGWNTGENYYKVVGYRQGAFLLNERGMYFNEVYQMELDPELFKKEVAVINEKVPIDYDYQANSILESLKSNEELGVISQDQYKRELGEMQEYAKVIE